MYPKQTIEIKVAPRLKGIDEEIDIDQETGELIMEIVPLQSEKVDFK